MSALKFHKMQKVWWIGVTDVEEICPTCGAVSIRGKFVPRAEAAMVTKIDVVSSGQDTGYILYRIQTPLRRRHTIEEMYLFASNEEMLDRYREMTAV